MRPNPTQALQIAGNSRTTTCLTQGVVAGQQQILGNTLITLYHELAHGLIDILGCMLGREEDAADAFALVELITQWHRNRCSPGCRFG